MTKAFYNRLEVLLKTIDKTFTNINSGGCGQFALMLGRKLETSGDVSIVCLQKVVKKEDLAEIEKAYKFLPDELEELNRNGGYISHIVIKFDGKYIDSTGILPNMEALQKAFKGFHVMTEVDLDKLEGWCKSDNWNSEFNSKQLPNMLDLLDKYYDKEITIMKRLNIYLDYLVD